MPPTIKKQTDISYTGSWTTGSENGSYSALRAFKAVPVGGVATGTATWSYSGLVAGRYRVGVAYPPLSNRTFGQKFQVIDSNGSTVLGTSYLVGKTAFPDFVYNTGRDAGPTGNVNWIYIGEFAISGTTASIVTDNSGPSSSEFAIVDAVYLEPEADAYTPVYRPRVYVNGAAYLADASTWATGDVPATNVAFSFGVHALVDLYVNANRTQGVPNGATDTAAITVTDGSTLTILDGYKLTVTGSVVLNDARAARASGYFPIVVGTGTNGGGATLEFDPSGSAAGVFHALGPGNNSQPNAFIKMRGVVGNEAIIQSAVGTTGSVISLRGFTAASTDCLQIDAQDAKLVRMGNQAARYFTNGQENKAATFATKSSAGLVSLVRFTTTGCYGGDPASGTASILEVGIQGAGGTITMTDVTLDDPAANGFYSAYLFSNGVAPAAVTITRTFLGSRFLTVFGAFNSAMTIADMVTNDSVNFGSSSGPTVNGMFGYYDETTDRISTYPIIGTLSNVFIFSSKTLGNPHSFAPLGATTLDTFVIDYYGADGGDTGDGFNVSESTAAGAICTIRNGVITKATTGTRSAGAIWRLTGGTAILYVDHVVAYSPNVDGGVQLGHGVGTLPYAADTCAEVTNCIFWALSPGIGTAINCDDTANVPEDYISPEGIHHNVFSNQKTGTNNIIAGVPGQSLAGMDNLRLSAAPTGNSTTTITLVDYEANFLKFVRTVLLLNTGVDATDLAAGRAYIKANRTVPRTTLIPFVHAGHKFTTASLATFGEGGLPPGVGYTAASAPTTTARRGLTPGARMGGR